MWQEFEVSHLLVLAVRSTPRNACASHCKMSWGSESGRAIWPAGSGTKTAWILPHAEGNLPAALDVAAHLRSHDRFAGWPEKGCGRNSKSRTYWFWQFGVRRGMRVLPTAK